MVSQERHKSDVILSRFCKKTATKNTTPVVEKLFLMKIVVICPAVVYLLQAPFSALPNNKEMSTL